jgi:hypothetical protein
MNPNIPRRVSDLQSGPIRGQIQRFLKELVRGPSPEPSPVPIPVRVDERAVRLDDR